MAVSGISITELNRDQIIAAALRKLGALAKGQVPDAQDLSDGTIALNALVAEFQTMGMPLWGSHIVTIPMTAGVRTYTIGSGQTTPLANMPQKILQAWTYVTTGNTSRQELIPTADSDYNLLPLNTNTAGVPSQFTYKPNINSGLLRIWPTPDATTASTRTLQIRYVAAFDFFVGATDTPSFPQQWNNALIYGLAALLAPEYGTPLNDGGSIEKLAEKHLNIALDSETEWASFYFQPDTREYY